MKKRNIYIYTLIIILLVSPLIGCKAEEQTKSKSEKVSVPPTLEQIQELSDEIVKTTMIKDWAESLKKTNELQSLWNDLYPDLQKQGVPNDEVKAFVDDLDILTDYLISKSINIPQKSANEENKDENKENDKNKEEKQGEEEKQSKSSEDQNSFEGEKNDPKKVLEEIDPIISAIEEDLIIINSSIEVTKHIPKFMLLFDSPIPPNMFKLKYLTRHLNVASKLGNWDVSSNDFQNLSDSWESVKSETSEIDTDSKIQLNQCINELKDIITSKNSSLTGIKSNIIIENIENVIKKLEEKEKEKEK